jgi:Ca2+-binding RTX toxin-like protein
MTSPLTSAATSYVANSGTTNIDALLSGYKWGASVGSSAILSYSFPWINGSSSVFSGPNGQPYDTKLDESTAEYHFGLNTIQQAAATAAINAWASVANISFSYVSETATNVGDIRFAFTSAVSSGSWGHTSFPSSYWPSAGDIWISHLLASNIEWQVGSYNFEALLHEIGHALGLKHPFESNPKLPTAWDSRVYTVMSYIDPLNDMYPNIGYVNGKTDWLTYRIFPDTPMVLDIAAIQYIYGANTSYKSGNDVYKYDPASPFFTSIWDAAGNDTISVANFSTNCDVDLTPGSYSSIRYLKPTNPGTVKVTYDGTNNLGIAYNCIIENAIGGSGNDKLTGNSVNNFLDGGPGNDLMYGGDGNDTFDWDSTKRSGTDKMYGGRGDDTFVFDSVFDVAVENPNEGTDTIWVSANYSIADHANIENLYGLGTASLNLVGNSASNYLRGSSGDDQIDGGAGSDYALFADKFAECIISPVGANFVVKTKSEGQDTVKNVEYLKFSDQTINLSLLSKPSTYTLTAASPSFDEGMNALFYLSTSGVLAGTLLNYSLSGVTASDISTGGLNGTVFVGADGRSTITVGLALDKLTEGDETLTISLQGAQASTTIKDISLSAVSTVIHTLSIIIDKGVISNSAVLIKDLVEKKTLSNGVVTNHIIEYAGSIFNYLSIDALVTTVTRDGDFTDAFRKEITDLLPSCANLSYKDAVTLVGSVNIESQLLFVAGADGSYVS